MLLEDIMGLLTLLDSHTRDGDSWDSYVITEQHSVFAFLDVNGDIKETSRWVDIYPGQTIMFYILGADEDCNYREYSANIDGILGIIYLSRMPI